MDFIKAKSVSPSVKDSDRAFTIFEKIQIEDLVFIKLQDALTNFPGVGDEFISDLDPDRNIGIDT